MSIPFGHQQLYNRYCFEGELELITPLHISSGRASDDTDAPFMRSFDGIPYIPGSTLRGVIRSEVERIIATVGDTVGLKTCMLFEKGDCAEKARDFLLKLGEEGRDERESKTKDECIAEFAERELCDVCKLFGSTVYASRLIFEDAQPVNEEIQTASGTAWALIGTREQQKTGPSLTMR
jgi:CRISPR/Cas system CSM-associated protein Csm3 (group 7 of RAMP superfamily)